MWKIVFVTRKSIELSLDNKHITTAVGKEVLFWDAQKFEVVKSYSLGVCFIFGFM